MAKRGQKKKMRGAESPTGSCLILCDDVLVSSVTGKQVIQGVIGGIRIPSLPATVGPFSAFVRLSNVYEGSEIEINFSGVESGESLFMLRATSSGPTDPLETHTLILRIPAFTVESYGRHILSASLVGQPPFVESIITIDELV